jgi:hypothetical protein
MSQYYTFSPRDCEEAEEKERGEDEEGVKQTKMKDKRKIKMRGGC